MDTPDMTICSRASGFVSAAVDAGVRRVAADPVPRPGRCRRHDFGRVARLGKVGIFTDVLKKYIFNEVQTVVQII
jgi:hypothetical protein